MGRMRVKKQSSSELMPVTVHCTAVSDPSLVNLSAYRLIGAYMSRFRRGSSSKSPPRPHILS